MLAGRAKREDGHELTPSGSMPRIMNRGLSFPDLIQKAWPEILAAEIDHEKGIIPTYSHCESDSDTRASWTKPHDPSAGLLLRNSLRINKHQVLIKIRSVTNERIGLKA